MADSTAMVQESFARLKPLVEERLDLYLQPDPDCPPPLLEAMRYSLLAGGKRLRPVLTLLACESCGGSAEAALPAACALEMVHTYSLIHDDLPAMDDDDFRRGRPTCHRQYGEGMAILAGDALLTLAFEIVARDIVPGHIAAECCADLASAAGMMGMVGGQVADLEAEAGGVSGLDQLEGIHKRKTGRLLSASLTLGGRVAGADSASLSALRAFGNCVGLAFQIADDLLDVTGDAVKMGKGVQKDAAHGKLTYPSQIGIDASRGKAQELIAEACRNIECLGFAGARLEALAHYVLERDH